VAVLLRKKQLTQLLLRLLLLRLLLLILLLLILLLLSKKEPVSLNGAGKIKGFSELKPFFMPFWVIFRIFGFSANPAFGL
jgi:hypothetical protein